LKVQRVKLRVFEDQGYFKTAGSSGGLVKFPLKINCFQVISMNFSVNIYIYYKNLLRNQNFQTIIYSISNLMIKLMF
jgi:hypothetical protein